jgi:serralysin
MCALCSLAGIAPGGLSCVDVSGDSGSGSGDVATDFAGATLSAPPAFSLAQIVQQLRTQWGGSFEGTTASWSGSGPIDYYIGGTPYSSGSGEIPYKTSMTALMVSRATLAFELWDDLIARDLNPVSTAASTQIQFEYATQTYNGSGVLSTNGGTYSKGWYNSTSSNSYGTTNYNLSRDEIWLNSNWTSHNADNDMYFGGYGFQTYMHEIGHSLGLSHPGTYNAGSGGTITYANNAEYSQDNRQFTIMSYFGGYAPGAGWQQDGTFSNWLYSSTPMLHDIAAVQQIYGADMTTRAGDTTYGFHSNAGREVFDFNIDTSPIVTVWDGGGNDTIDLSGYSTGQRLDLHAGVFSDVAGMLSNFAIAYNVIIENGIGGSGNDTLIGNDTNNTLRGGPGNDIIDGGTAFDTAVFFGPRSAYTLTDLGGGSVRVSGPDGIDTVANVEQLRFDDQTVAVIVTPPPPPPPATATVASSDFDGDHRSDILWQVNGGALAVWEMNGTQIKAADYMRLGSAPVGAPGSDWHIVATDILPSDFDGDGKGDVLWRTDGGALAVWQMNGTQIKSADYIRSGSTPVGAPGSDWHVVITGDFDGDGKADLLWRTDSGLLAIWQMNGNQIAAADYLRSGSSVVATPGTNWHVLGADDFDGDGRGDLLWRTDDGTLAIWEMNGTQIKGADYLRSGSAVVKTPGTDWHLVGTGDFDGDGKGDLLWRTDSGLLAVWEMNGTQIKAADYVRVGSVPVGAPGTDWHVYGTGDFDGDGRDDIMWKTDGGALAIWKMNGFQISAADYLRLGPTQVGVPTTDWNIVQHHYDLV